MPMGTWVRLVRGAGEAHDGGSARAAHYRDNRWTLADTPRTLQYKWGHFDMRWKLRISTRRSSRRRSSTRRPSPRRSSSRRSWRHAADAVDQHRSPFHCNGCCRLAYLFRCAGSAARRSGDWTHRWSRGHEVRLAAAERRVRQAVWGGNAQVAAAGGSKILNQGWNPFGLTLSGSVLKGGPQ